MLLAVIVILVELLITRNYTALQIIIVSGLLITIAVTVLVEGSAGGSFNAMIISDTFTTLFKILLLGIALFTVLVSKEYFKKLNIRHGEYYCVLLTATLGMMFLAGASNFLTMFLGIETMSISLYLLAGSKKNNQKSAESALKYFLLGAFSTGFLLYGIALIYGTTGGALNFSEVAKSIAQFDVSNPAPLHLHIGIGLLLTGLLFKVAAVPLHFWSPDVYQGAPTPVTAFMSAGPKAAAMIVLLRLFGWTFPDLSGIWEPILGIVAAATMIYANITALAQKDIKRMLAYSSISHAGYLLLAVLAARNGDIRLDAASGMFFYLIVYYLMNLGAFTIAIIVNRARPKGEYSISDYKGLASKYPWISAVMALFMISLAGIPPTAGFMGKLYLFSTAVEANLIILVVIAVLTSVVSAFYYLRIVVFMFMKPLESTVYPEIKVSKSYKTVLALCSAAIIILGIIPGRIIEKTSKSSQDIEFPSPSSDRVGQLESLNAREL